MPNLYLPKKDDVTVQHTLTTADTYSWTAPDAHGDSTNYNIVVESLGAGGGGGSGGSSHQGGGGAGSGAYFKSEIEVKPGETYTLEVGAGGNGGATVSNTTGNNGTSGAWSGITYSTGYVKALGGYYGQGGKSDGTQGAGGNGGTYSHSDVTNLLLKSTLCYASGASGGDGKYNPASNDSGYAQAGSSFSSCTASNSGGAGGYYCCYDGAGKDASGGGSGASYFKSGATGGASTGSCSGSHNTGTAGGAGASGYTIGATGGAHTSSSPLWHGAYGGNGASGFLKISYTLKGGASDNAPTT